MSGGPPPWSQTAWPATGKLFPQQTVCPGDINIEIGGRGGGAPPTRNSHPRLLEILLAKCCPCSVAPVPLFAAPPSAVSSSTPKCLTGRSERTRALAVTAPHKARLLPQTRKRTFGLRDKQSGGREGEDASALQALQHLGRLQRREPKLLDKLGPLQAAEKLAVHGVLSGNTNASPGTQNAQFNIFSCFGNLF